MKLYDKLKNNEVYIIAEMSANHGGKIENAFRIIEEAAKAGADCSENPDLYSRYAYY